MYEFDHRSCIAFYLPHANGGKKYTREKKVSLMKSFIFSCLSQINDIYLYLT